MGKLGQDSWEKISDRFYQKKTTDEEGVSTNTYYYRSKLGKRVATFEINTPISRRLCGYTLIENDIKDCREFLGEYLKIINEENSHQLMVKALIKSLVITYGKCFATAEVRKIKLEKDILTQKNKNTHHEMIRMRNEYIAHAGSSSDEYCRFVILLPSEKIFKKKNFIQPEGYKELCQRVHSKLFPNDCKSLLEEIDSHLKEKISSLTDKMNEEIKSLLPDKLYNLSAKSNHARCILKKEDLKRMGR